MIIKANNKKLDLINPHVMGILNVTPDSFSDGGQYDAVDAALSHAERMIDAGVSIIDVGGESTRPGASFVPLDIELERVIPVIETIRSKHDVWISVDTSRPEVITQAAKAGADMINDIRALQIEGALEAAAHTGLPVCLMHMQGEPGTMQNNPQYEDLFDDINTFFEERISACKAKGIDESNIIIDPGFGFGKTLEQNYELLANLNLLHKHKQPILVGMSRKSMVFRLLRKEPKECVNASVVLATIAATKQAQIIRVHDFEETLEAVKIVGMMNSCL